MHHPDFSTARHTPPLFPLRAGSVPGGHVTANTTAEGRPQPAAEHCALLPPFLPPQWDRGETGKSKGEKGLGSRKSQFNKQRGRKEKNTRPVARLILSPSSQSYRKLCLSSRKPQCRAAAHLQEFNCCSPPGEGERHGVSAADLGQDLVVHGLESLLEVRAGSGGTVGESSMQAGGTAPPPPRALKGLCDVLQNKNCLLRKASSLAAWQGAKQLKQENAELLPLPSNWKKDPGH